MTGTNFAHLCLQKLYVLCSRGAQAQVACLQEVAQLALPVLLSRCRGVLRGYLAGGGEGGPSVEEVRQQLLVAVAHDAQQVEQVMEVLLGMTLTPAVADALLASHPGPQAVVGAARGRRAKGNERAHLLVLYGTLCECVMVAEPRIRCVVVQAGCLHTKMCREMVCKALQLAGKELVLIETV